MRLRHFNRQNSKIQLPVLFEVMLISKFFALYLARIGKFHSNFKRKHISLCVCLTLFFTATGYFEIESSLYGYIILSSGGMQRDLPIVVYMYIVCKFYTYICRYMYAQTQTYTNSRICMCSIAINAHI